MRKVLLFYVAAISLVSAAQNQSVRPFDNEAIRDMLEGFAVMEADNEGDPHQQNLPTVADCYRMMEKRCEEAGVDKRRILDVAKEEIDRCAAYVRNTGRTSIAINAVRLLDLVAHSGDRSLLPYLEKKSLDPETPASVRSAAAKIYVSFATGEECAALLPEILKIDNQTVWTAGWRSGVLSACLHKIDDAIAKGELSDETLNLLVGKLLAHTQSLSVPRLADGDMIDRFLIQHCVGYATSQQRLAMWTEYFDELGDESWEEDLREKFTPTKESLEAIPPSKRIDLRKRFPDLPPLPGDAPARSPVKVAFAIIAGVVAVIAAWFVLRRRKVRKAA